MRNQYESLFAFAFLPLIVPSIPSTNTTRCHCTLFCHICIMIMLLLLFDALKKNNNGVRIVGQCLMWQRVDVGHSAQLVLYNKLLRRALRAIFEEIPDPRHRSGIAPEKADQ